MIFHPRRDWTKVAAANANPVIRSLLKGTAIHWNGPPVPLSALTDPRSYLEGVRRYHVNVKGWSDIAYNYAVDQLGNVWELRGWGYQSGANGGTLVNDQYLAILCIVGQGQTPSAAMLVGVQRAVESFRATYKDARAIVTHHAIRPDPTECPGAALTQAVRLGVFEPPLPAPAKPIVDLSWIARVARQNPWGYRAGTRTVQAALKAEGLLGHVIAGRFGASTRRAYAGWQRSIGYTGVDADGIPGLSSLTRLGKKRGFTVAP